MISQKALENDLSFPNLLKELNFDEPSLRKVYGVIMEKNLFYVLFNFTNNGEFFYDDHSEFLMVQRFKHSILLEFI